MEVRLLAQQRAPTHPLAVSTLTGRTRARERTLNRFLSLCGRNPRPAPHVS
ncbi:hypothetical protein NOCARDAX2BIS_220144 [Nocardioides sp. AX2bis]|nr:hypothetical protein NOCARDAX2BIS_220144 [Nocardioides sp. AX2bis]